MPETISVPSTFVQKVIGLTEAVKGIMDKKASSKENLQTAATEAVTALAKKGYVEQEKAAAMIEGFATQPELALQALTKMAGSAPHIDEVASPGAPAEKEGAAKTGGSKKESDRIWDEGFGLG
jgi:hypothetical protein